MAGLRGRTLTWQTFSMTWERDDGETPPGVTAAGGPVTVPEGTSFQTLWRGCDGNSYYSGPVNVRQSW